MMVLVEELTSRRSMMHFWASMLSYEPHSLLHWINLSLRLAKVSLAWRTNGSYVRAL